MKRILLSFLLLSVVLNLSSQSYLFDSISDNLKRRADAVVRSEQCLYTIIDANHATEKIKTAVTLLNENSYRYRYLRVRYDKNSKVNYLKGTIYDETGKIIKVLGFFDVQDLSAVPGGTFYSDDRMKFLYFPIYKYPYTIEYEYEIEYSKIYTYASWYFQNQPRQSVEKSGIQYFVPKQMNFRFNTENLNNNVDSVVNPDYRIYTWQEENIPAVLEQSYSTRIHYPWPVVSAAPLDFNYGGFKGSLSSWKAYGEWMYNLIKGRDVLPDDDLKKVTEVTAQTNDLRERAKLIYEYVQSRTRYVSIQIGIGGFQPSEASLVSKNGYGDCKGLVNYTMALLRATGVNAWYTLVKAGKDGRIIKDFVSDQFDHIILCVPMPKDTVWLECTSQTLPFNYLSGFTDDRYALLITPEGGKLVRTPEFNKDENVFKRTGFVSLNNFGKSSARLAELYSGNKYDTASVMFGLASDDEMKRYLNSAMRFSSIDVGSVKFSETKSEKPTARLSYELTINDFATMVGKNIVFNPSIEKVEYVQDRPMAIEIPGYSISYDSIAYNLPLGYKIEYKPSDILLESEFGKFSYQLEAKNDRIVYKRYLALNKGDIPVEKFQDFRSFINSVAKVDRERIVLNK